MNKNFVNKLAFPIHTRLTHFSPNGTEVRELQVRLRQAEDMAAASKQRADQSGAALQAMQTLEQ